MQGTVRMLVTFCANIRTLTNKEQTGDLGQADHLALTHTGLVHI